jgi:predicted  nucleic acid-binding Zn-ribbon protein
MGVFDDLLRLQGYDTTADQLRHRREVLPERAALIDLAKASTELEAAAATVQAQRDELARAQRRLEDEVTGIEEKVAHEDRTLYSGSVTSPKELQAIQDEIASLGRRQSALEDQVIELMEQAEPLDGQLVEAEATRGRLEAETAEAVASLAAGEAAIDDELASVAAARAEVAPSIPDDLLAHYETLRTQLGGVAVARLEGDVCGGCRLILPAVELDTIRHQPPDARVHCEECGRLLVR